MKSSIHLFYGIIIGILAMFCVGSIKTDKKEFNDEEIITSSSSSLTIMQRRQIETMEKMEKWKKDGWTIIDWEMDNGEHYFHVGK